MLFISIDDLTPELGFYGNDLIHTPNLDRLAASAVVFDRAYCQVPVCGASRASLLTGLLPTKERFTRFNSRADEDAPTVATLPQHFKENGYHTISNGKVFHSSDDSSAASWSVKPWLPGVSHAQERDPESKNFRGGLRNRGPYFESADVEDDAYFDGLVARKTVQDLEALAGSDEPFFLATGFIRPHLPFYAPKKYWDLYDSEKIPLAEFRSKPANAPESLKGSGEIQFYDMRGLEYNSDSFHKMARWGYYACISYIDAQVQLVLDALEASGHADNTIVVVWGDHGFHLGDHDMWGKLTNMHSSLRVPMLIRLPGMDETVRVSSLVELVDLYPTLCDLVGISKPEHLQGDSLLGVMQGFSPDSNNAYSRMFEGDTITTEDAIYTKYTLKDSKEETMLYDLVKDPGETQNVVGLEEYSEQAQELASALDQRIDQSNAFSSSKPLWVMPLGDSITRGRNGDTLDFTGGYRKPLEVILDQHFNPEDWRFVGEIRTDSPNMRNQRHQGLGGIDVAGILEGDSRGRKNSRIDILIQTQAPEIIILNIGTNDLSRMSANEAIRDYSKLLAEIWKTRPSAIIVGNTLLGRSSDQKKALHERFMQFNELLRAKALAWEQTGKYHLVDLAPLANVGTMEDLPDTVHPSQALYREIAEELSKTLIPLMQSKITSEKE
ncbi:sulfatase-like hydrolase/transferase [Coraliomargarita sp. W4R72]